MLEIQKLVLETKIYPFASVGTDPQDLKFKGEKNNLIIGKKNTIREYVTINPGTEGGGRNNNNWRQLFIYDFFSCSS